MTDDDRITATECRESTARGLFEAEKTWLDEFSTRLLGPIIDRTSAILLGAKPSDDNHKGEMTMPEVTKEDVDRELVKAAKLWGGTITPLIAKMEAAQRDTLAGEGVDQTRLKPEDLTPLLKEINVLLTEVFDHLGSLDDHKEK